MYVAHCSEGDPSLCFFPFVFPRSEGSLKVRMWVLQNDSFGEVQRIYYQQLLNNYNV